jgi:hypothetical protein
MILSENRARWEREVKIRMSLAREMDHEISEQSQQLHQALAVAQGTGI